MLTRRELLASAAPALLVTPAVAVCAPPAEPVSPHERAEHHLREFARAMDDMAAEAGADHWHFFGATGGGGQHVRASEVRLVAYDQEAMGLTDGMIVERVTRVKLPL